MGLLEAGLLVTIGLFAGFLAGLVGIGGGIIYVPVLFFYFEHTGVPVDIITPLTLGTSLLCTLIAGGSSAWFQLRRRAVELRTAVVVGLFSAAAIVLTTYFITTQPWYSPTIFQILFSLTLLAVVARMVLARQPRIIPERARKRLQPGMAVMAGTGGATGALSAAVGVGGGTVLVPAYSEIFRLPMTSAVGTSSATIVLISLSGVASYTIAGLGTAATDLALGFVDYGGGLLLCLPSVLTARWGVRLAHYVNNRILRWCFATVALLVAARLLMRALG